MPGPGSAKTAGTEVLSKSALTTTTPRHVCLGHGVMNFFLEIPLVTFFEGGFTLRAHGRFFIVTVFDKESEGDLSPVTIQHPLPSPPQRSLPTNPSESSSSSTPNHNTFDAVKVVCRLRPHLPNEPNAAKSIVQVLNNTEIRITDPHKHLVNRFDFSACYDEQSTQQDIYSGQVQELVTKIFDGVVKRYEHNKKPRVSIADITDEITLQHSSFGCTGSGKTHTLQGSPTDPGITLRAVRTIFERVETLKLNSENQYNTCQVSISCFEIWKDKVWDLLVQGGTATTRDVGRGDLPIRESANGQVFIPHLRHVTIKSIAQFDKLYTQVMRFRSVSSTKLNHTSSRSHAILTIHVDQLSQEGTIIQQGKCVLIDLAGSENNKKTGNENNKERMKESVEINQSLLALRKVVRSLNTGDHRIPYRDSKLTRILSDSLGGTSAGLVICNIAPVASQYRDTINTLNFGSHTRNFLSTFQLNLHFFFLWVGYSAERKFLLPAVSLYRHNAKSVPTLSLAHATAEPIHSPIKLSWVRKQSGDALSKLPFPHTLINSTGVPTPSPPPKQTGEMPDRQPISLGGRMRKLSNSSTARSSSVGFSGSRKLNFRPSAPSLKGSSPAIATGPFQLEELDKRVGEAMRKNLDELVQNRVDMLVQAKLNDGSFNVRSGSQMRHVSPGSDHCRIYDSPIRPPTVAVRTPHQHEDGERLEERICHLEQQLLVIPIPFCLTKKKKKGTEKVLEQREYQQLTPVCHHLFSPQIRNKNSSSLPLLIRLSAPCPRAGAGSTTHASCALSLTKPLWGEQQKAVHTSGGLCPMSEFLSGKIVSCCGSKS
ncbi:hypothetical protein VP01_11g10 [Puccinia sorghi]|uniref:Kinesin motor domain-containing protein n=1 Tax=Puccinia sorghi TaxID=27349 RepID=A0A0L6VQS0_9BASI|nr:hypothetical protein VP01_11g10 [Puccinia sorghi]